MLRKTILLCVVIPLLYTVYCSMSSCRTYKVKVCRLNFYAGNSDGDTTAAPLTKFWFFITTDFIEQCFVAAPRNPFISSCYAFKKCYTWLNGLDIATFSLTFNRPIYSGADTLAPGVNIINHPVFGKYTTISGKGAGCDDIRYEIGSNDSTLIGGSLTFDTGYYAALLTCRTTDGAVLQDMHFVVFGR